MYRYKRKTEQRAIVEMVSGSGRMEIKDIRRFKAWFTCTGTLLESIGIGTSSEYFEEISWFS